MIYQATITTPANTPESNKLKTILKVTKGLVYRVEVYIPPGASGLHHITVNDGNFQMIPTSIGESLTGDNILIAFDEVYLKLTEPFEFQIYTWNDDDTFDHTVIIRVGMVSKEIFMARYLPTYAYDYQVKIMKKLQEEQARIVKEQTGTTVPSLGV